MTTEQFTRLCREVVRHYREHGISAGQDLLSFQQRAGEDQSLPLFLPGRQLPNDGG